MSKNDPRLDRIRERINALEPQLVDYSYFKSKLSGISRPRRAAAFFVKVTKPSGHGMVYSYGYNWSDGNYGSQSAYQAHEKWPLREKLQKAKSQLAELEALLAQEGSKWKKWRLFRSINGKLGSIERAVKSYKKEGLVLEYGYTAFDVANRIYREVVLRGEGLPAY